MTQSRRGQAAILVILASLTALAPLSVDFYLPGLPELTADLNTNQSTAQLTLTGFLLGLALSQLVAGSMSDSLGRRPPVLFGVLAYVAVSLACAAAPGVEALIVLRLAQGLAAGIGFVIARAIVRDVFAGAAAARIFAVLVMITGVAPILAPIAGGQLLRFTTWRGIFVVLAGIGAMILAFSALRLHETLPAHFRHEPGLRTKLHVFRRLLSDGTFVPFALTGSLSFGAMFAYISGSPFVLQDIYDVSPQAYGLIFGVNAAGLVTCSQLSRKLVERTGPGPLLSAGATAMGAATAGSVLVIALDLGLVPLLACLFVTMSTIGLIMPNATALSLAHQGQAAGSASALFGLAQFGLGAAVAPLVGVAGPETAWPMVLAMAACGLSSFTIDRIFGARAKGEPLPSQAEEDSLGPAV